jgi:hypothetical protein
MLTHRSPKTVTGQIRITIPAVSGSPTNALAIQFQLLSCEGIEGISANAANGTVLIDYTPTRMSLARVVDLLHELGWLEEIATSRAEGTAGPIPA